MNVVILTSVRLLGDGLHACLADRNEVTIVTIASKFSALRDALGGASIDLILIDITQGIDLAEVRTLAAEWPDVALVALGLCEQRQDVVRCGRAGFAGYVARDATVEVLCRSMLDAVAGRLACPADISGGLLRALFRTDTPLAPPAATASLTSREGDVQQLIGRGLSNKEIARELNLGVATIKHHVHNLLGKLNLPWPTRHAPRARHALDRIVVAAHDQKQIVLSARDTHQAPYSKAQATLR